MAFDPKQHMTKLQGKDYLEVRWRLVWFREAYPAGSITTDLVSIEPSVVVKATVSTPDGILATGYGSAPPAGKGPYTGRAIEKAETAAIGRALAVAGFGTQFDADSEGDNLADAPVEPPALKQQGTQPRRLAGPPPVNHVPAVPADDAAPAKVRTLQRDEATALIAWAAATFYEGDALAAQQAMLPALQVKRMGEFAGTLEQAKAVVMAYVAKKTAEPF